MKFINFKLILSILLLSSINAFAVIDVVHLGSFGKSGAWQAKEFKDGTSKICYIISKPVATNPSDLNRGEHAFMITNFQSDGTSHEASVCLLYTSPSPRDSALSRMPSSA